MVDRYKSRNQEPITSELVSQYLRTESIDPVTRLNLGTNLLFSICSITCAIFAKALNKHHNNLVMLECSSSFSFLAKSSHLKDFQGLVLNHFKQAREPRIANQSKASSQYFYLRNRTGHCVNFLGIG